MILFNKISITKFKKVVLPSIQVKDLKPIANLLYPQNIIVPLFFISVLAQITDNLKSILSSKEVQQLHSVKLYAKVISNGTNSLSLSAVQAISKTLGPELEILSILNVQERINFLRSLQKKLIVDKTYSSILVNSQKFCDPILLSKHRKGLAMQARSIMIATPLFDTYSIVMGISIGTINLDIILQSSKLIWISLGLLEEDFDFLLRKESLNISKDFCFDIKNNIDALKLLVYSELRAVLGFTGRLKFSDDQVILRGEDNLTLLEKELGFVDRLLPQLPKEFFVSDSLLGDVILRASVDQRRNSNSKLENIFKRSGRSIRKNQNRYDLKEFKIHTNFIY
jgi:hypothetical protein